MCKFKMTYFEGFQMFYVGQWLKRIVRLASKNNYTVTFMSAGGILSIEALKLLWKQEIFGTTNFVLILVFGTVLINTYYGVRKSKKIRDYYQRKLILYEDDSVSHDLFEAKIQLHVFDPRRLQFVVFKCLSLLGYLFFVTTLLEDTGTIFDYGAEIMSKTPLAIFWYYEFKSIGDNSAIIYNKKASIFKIIEDIFEIKIAKFFGDRDSSTSNTKKGTRYEETNSYIEEYDRNNEENNEDNL